MVSIADLQANVDNYNKLVGDAEHYKARMLNMKDTLVKERGEGRESKRKHGTTISEFEKLQKEYQYLESEKDAVALSVTITEGEKRDI